MTQRQYSHRFENGLTLLAEEMSWLESTAFSILIPAGYVYDPTERPGLGNFTCEMVQRGCGSRGSREFVESLDRLGVDRSASVSGAHTSFGGAMLADNLFDTLGVYADLVRSPHLPEDQLEEGRQVCLQELWSVEDDLAQKAMLGLRDLHYGHPWGRSCQGTEESIQSIDASDIRKFFQQRFQPDGAILSVAGKLDWDQLVPRVDQLFGDWSKSSSDPIVETPGMGGYKHIDFDSNQTHIAVAFPGVPYRDPDYFQARGAVGVLSDGMSSRLFTEVRENRGLCYTVYATCHSLRDRGSVFAYSGTSTERAQETLDVLIHELLRIADGIEQTELDRLKARIKSSLIMQQESSASRAGSISADWYHLGRIRSMEEIGEILDNLTCDSINTYLKKNPPQNFSVVTLGEKKLEVPVAVS